MTSRVYWYAFVFQAACEGFNLISQDIFLAQRISLESWVTFCIHCIDPYHFNNIWIEWTWRKQTYCLAEIYKILIIWERRKMVISDGYSGSNFFALLGNFARFFVVCWFNFKCNVFQIFFQEYHQNVHQFESRPGPQIIIFSHAQLSWAGN